MKTSFLVTYIDPYTKQDIDRLAFGYSENEIMQQIESKPNCKRN